MASERNTMGGCVSLGRRLIGAGPWLREVARVQRIALNRAAFDGPTRPRQRRGTGQTRVTFRKTSSGLHARQLSFSSSCLTTLWRGMSITPYLDGLNVDSETERVLGLALDMTRLALGVEDDLANKIIAKTILEVAKAGERNPDLLCEGALKKLRRHHLFGD
jgi:hypothetical protein